MMNGLAPLGLAANHAIQIAVLAVVVLCLTRWWAKDRPHLAHMLWALVLLKCLAPPVIPSPISPFSWLANCIVTPVLKEPPLLIHEPAAETKIRIEAQARAPAMTPQPDDEQRLASAQANGFSSKWGWLVLAWAASTLLLLMYFMVRFFNFTSLVRGTSLEVSSAVVDEVTRLRQQLGIRRPVQVRVLDAPIGPAVMGIWRPVLLLPRTIVDAAQPAHLRLLLAHELVHIRRGDLIWSALQVVASSLWWFHPAVWLTNRLVTRESERSCDEETIASLACPPATYARSLLAVLEVRQQLCAAPIVPGLRPVDITSERMERIMRIGHGSRSHTPGWVVAALITGAVILLPGAAWLQAKEKADEEAAVDPQPVAVASTVIAAAENEGQLLKASIVFLEVPVDWVQKIRPVITSNAEVNDAATIVTTGTRLPNEQSASQASVNQRLPAAVPTTSQWLMDDATLAIVAEWSQGSSDSPVKILNRPQLVMVSGSAASLTIGAEMPFVVAVDAETGQPTVDIRNLGLTCKLTATLPDVDLNAAAEKTHRWVGVHCVLTREDLIKVNETIFTSKTGATTKLQSPVVACHKIEFAMNAALGATFATAFGVKTVDDGQRTTVCLVTVDKMPKSASAQTTQSFDASDEPEFKIEK